MKAFPIDFVRKVFEQTLTEQNMLEPSKYIGGENQVALFSFYEQLQNQDEVNRYVERYRDLVNQQNRTSLILNGIVLAPENPTITNVYRSTIVPFTFTFNFRTTLANRDKAIETFNNAIELLKGRVAQVVEFEDGTLFKVGTIGNNENNVNLKNYDYLLDSCDYLNPTTEVRAKLSSLLSIGIGSTGVNYYYLTDNLNKLRAVRKLTSTSYAFVDDNNTYHDIIVPPNKSISNYWNLDLSFESFRVDEPMILDSKEYCNISFGGSATLSSRDVFLGNQLVKVGIGKYQIKGSPNISCYTSPTYLEPMELPNSLNVGTQISQLMSNKFVQNSHADNISPTNQYTFILNRNIPLIKQWFEYSRYGKQADGTTITYTNGITPNMIYNVYEYWVSWADVERNHYHGKIIESIDCETTESDVMTITIPMQVQGEN